MKTYELRNYYAVYMLIMLEGNKRWKTNTQVLMELC